MESSYWSHCVAQWLLEAPVPGNASRRAERTRKLICGGSRRLAGPTVTHAGVERGQLGQGTLACLRVADRDVEPGDECRTAWAKF